MSEDNSKKLGLFLLIGLGVGSMIGAGIFNSPTDLILSANPQAVIIAWLIGGTGVLMIALVFQMLSNKKPELTGGIYTYAKEGFGDFAGFNSAWGYWIGAFLGNVAFFTIIFKTINSLLGKGNQLSPLATFILGSVLLWVYHFMITRGIKNASFLNAIFTAAKIIPLLLVIVLGFIVFKSDIFSVPNWTNHLASATKGQGVSSVGQQIKGAMCTILWCFSGIEASVVMSKRAKSAKLVGKATLISFGITITLYMLISIVSMGVIPAEALASSDTPLAAVLGKTILAGAGGIIVKVGILISVIGVLISWILLAAETPYIAANAKVMPRWFAKENKVGVPINSLTITTIVTQLFLFFLMIPELQKAYTITYTLGTIVMMLPYLFSTAYAVKLSVTEKYKKRELIISVLASIYSLYVIYAIGLKYFAFSIIIYSIGIIPFVMAKKENGVKLTSREKTVITIMAVAAVAMVVMLIAGIISL